MVRRINRNTPDVSVEGYEPDRKMRRLDWGLLEYFRAAGKLQHVTKAAIALGTSQPALSRALKRLEDDLGVPLFDRKGRAISLNRYGEILLRRVGLALAHVESGQMEIADMIAGDTGVVNLGFLRTLGTHFVPQLVRQFIAHHPNTRFAFTQTQSAQLADKLYEGELDLIITSSPPTASRYKWTRVAIHDLVLIVPKFHPLAKRKEISLREVAGEHFVSFHKTHAVRSLTDKACKKAGFVPNYSFEADDWSSVPGFVAAGFGVAVAPLESSRFVGVRGLRITEPRVQRAVGVGWMEDRFMSLSAARFRDFAIAQYRKSQATDR